MQHFEIVAVVTEDGLQKIEMNGAHLGGENGIALALHLLGVVHALIGLDVRSRMNAALTPHGDGGKQRTNADAHRTEVVDLVDLEAGVELAALL